MREGNESFGNNNLFSCAEQQHKIQAPKYYYTLESRSKLDTSGIYALWWQQVKCTCTGYHFWLLLSAPEWSVLEAVSLCGALQTLCNASTLLGHGLFQKLSECN